MDSVTLRNKAKLAWDVTSADGAEIGGTDAYVTITLKFKRERKVDDGHDHRVHDLGCRGHAVVAPEVAAAGGDTEVAPSLVDDGGAYVSAKIVEQIKSMSGDTGVAAPQPIDGVEPVVVEAFIDNRFESSPWNPGGVLAVYRKDGGKDRPCTVAIWPGVKNGKKVRT